MTPDLIVAGLVSGCALLGPAGWLIAGGVQQGRRERRETRGLVVLAGVATARPGCGCTFWDARADRADYRPCKWHAEQLLADVTVPFPLPPAPLDRDYIEQRGRRK